jgi:hypothetical protein
VRKNFAQFVKITHLTTRPLVVQIPLQNKSHYYFIAADKVRRSATALRPIRRHFQLISQQAESASRDKVLPFICSFIHEKNDSFARKKGHRQRENAQRRLIGRSGRHVTAGTAPNLNALERPLNAFS